MKISKRIISLFLIFLILIITFGYYLYYKEKKSYLKKVISPSIGITKFLLTETYKGKKVWEIKADKAKILKDKIQLNNIWVKFFLEDGSFFTIVADKGRIDTLSKDFKLFGNVIVASKEKLNLETEVLNWNSKDKVIFTPSLVKITQDEYIITGEGFKLFPNQRRAEILAKVKIVLK
jgi:LPS export ABC transporter protein LptC